MKMKWTWIHGSGTLAAQWFHNGPAPPRRKCPNLTMFRDWWQVIDVAFRHLMVKAFGFLITGDHLT